MPLLVMVQDVADVVGVGRPVAVVGNQDQLARQMYGFAQEALEELSLMDWPVLTQVHTFATVPGQDKYDLPLDFEHQVGDTVYRSAQYDMLRGQLTPGDWARQRNSLPDLGRWRFRIFGNPLKLVIMPTPTLAEDVMFEYKTLMRVKKADTTLAPRYVEDTDVPLVPEELVKKGLKWRIRRGKGLDYTEEFDDYEIARNSRLAQQLQFGSMPVAYRSAYDDSPITDGYVPETGFGT